uniref:Uncharacterized protein n=1 Tax=Arundo donax TaxID=35708 RepID=A0A0A9B9R0_ARUDO
MVPSSSLSPSCIYLSCDAFAIERGILPLSWQSLRIRFWRFGRVKPISNRRTPERALLPDSSNVVTDEMLKRLLGIVPLSWL